MRNLTCALLLICTHCFGQKKEIQNIASIVSIERLKKNLYYLASEQLEGRVMGSKGDTLASEYIINCFKENHLAAPYNNGTSYFQTVNSYRKNLLQSQLIIGEKKYENWNGWGFGMRSVESVLLDNIPVVFAGYGIENSLYNDFANIDVKGKAVLLLTGQPQDSTGIYLLSGTKQAAIISSYQNVLRDKGASLILLYNNRFAAESSIQQKSAFQAVYKIPFLQNNNLPVIMLSEERANELLAHSDKSIKSLARDITKTLRPQSFVVNNTVSCHIKIDITEEKAPNVIGVINGSDSTAGCIILSAHHDHLGKDGNTIYYGAVDNASGTVAIMEIAMLMNKAVEKGFRPKRTIIFASYTGEEKGLLGSYHFSTNPLFPVEKTHAVLNIDMMGRVDTFYTGKRADSNYAYILVIDSLNRGLRKALFTANEKLGKLKLDTYYEQPQFMQRRLMGSDQYPFYLKGVPFIRIDCGFSKDYHQPTDTPDKINYELLSDQIKLAFLTTWNIAND
ncbi:M28 family peptidase [Flavihumibacter fluvii]|uniref:M28 family peptidase n=1 Tax=Flavihumibacter fluvii TaxID=2838157 RepID=UPI001BDE7D83|nr:M28 family peptidase [Flavihumibacter fluvii]ULQ53392.1 M28 family peptidase [Flavihumibacter fluvii]